MAKSRYQVKAEHDEKVRNLRKLIASYRDLIMCHMAMDKNTKIYSLYPNCVRLGHLMSMRWIMIPWVDLPIDKKFLKEFDTLESTKNTKSHFRTYKLRT